MDKEKAIINLKSKNGTEEYSIEIYRSRTKINKIKINYTNLARKQYTLRRLDINGLVHRNPPKLPRSNNIPDSLISLLSHYVGKTVKCPHVHIYVEGYNDKWAVPIHEVPELNILGKNIIQITREFFDYCNVKKIPYIKFPLEEAWIYDKL